MLRGNKDRGFSLVEVILAMGLLSGVLIATAGMFIVGGKQVKSGRTSSEALAVGKEIQEDLVGWGYSQLWEGFGYDGQATAYTVDTRTCASCASWQSTLASKLGPSAFATIHLDSIGSASAGPTNFADASGAILARSVRVGVTVSWTEAPGRVRSLTLGTTRN